MTSTCCNGQVMLFPFLLFHEPITLYGSSPVTVLGWAAELQAVVNRMMAPHSPPTPPPPGVEIPVPRICERVTFRGKGE